MNKLHAVASVE